MNRNAHNRGRFMIDKDCSDASSRIFELASTGHSLSLVAVVEMRSSCRRKTIEILEFFDDPIDPTAACL